MKKFLAVICLLMLVACNIKLFSSINISDILSSDNKVAMVDLNVNVSSCNENDIKKIETALNKRDIVAHYNKCTHETWNDYATFSMPLSIIKGNDSSTKPLGDIYLSYFSGKLALVTSDRIETVLKSDSEFSSNFKITSIELALVNDTNETIKIKPAMVFVDEKPILADIVNISPYNKVIIKLSDVANKLLERSNMVYPVLEFVND